MPTEALKSQVLSSNVDCKSSFHSLVASVGDTLEFEVKFKQDGKLMSAIALQHPTKRDFMEGREVFFAPAPKCEDWRRVNVNQNTKKEAKQFLKSEKATNAVLRQGEFNSFFLFNSD